MNYPISLSFKILAIANQVYIRDGSGSLIGYMKQKLFKLKEDINIFADENQTQMLFNIKADRVIDWSANYSFTTRAQAISDRSNVRACARSGKRATTFSTRPEIRR